MADILAIDGHNAPELRYPAGHTHAPCAAGFIGCLQCLSTNKVAVVKLDKATKAGLEWCRFRPEV